VSADDCRYIHAASGSYIQEITITEIKKQSQSPAIYVIKREQVLKILWHKGIVWVSQIETLQLVLLEEASNKLSFHRFRAN
jgi:hypothetical protein